MTKLFNRYCRVILMCGFLTLIAATNSFADNSILYKNSGLNESQYITMKNVNTHICMITGLQARYSAADEEQIKRVDNNWRLYGGTYVEATCYAHQDFWKKTGNYSSSYWNGTAWARAVAQPSNSCQSYVNYDTGDATGIVYMRGFNGEFNDPDANPLPWNSFVAITQATLATIPGTNPIQRAKSNIKVRVDACTSEFYLLGGLFAWLPVGDYTQRSRLSVGWYKAGKSNQMAKFVASNDERVFATSSSSEFSASASEFNTKETRMALANEAACYLTYFGGQGGSVSIQQKRGRWTLIAKSNSISLGPRISARARCYAYDQSDLSGESGGSNDPILY